MLRFFMLSALFLVSCQNEGVFISDRVEKCTVTSSEEGALVSCPDGSNFLIEVPIPDPCEVRDFDDRCVIIECENTEEIICDGNDGINGSNGENGQNGVAGDDGEPCSIDEQNGCFIVQCPDQSEEICPENVSDNSEDQTQVCALDFLQNEELQPSFFELILSEPGDTNIMNGCAEIRANQITVQGEWIRDVNFLSDLIAIRHPRFLSPSPLIIRDTSDDVDFSMLASRPLLLGSIQFEDTRSELLSLTNRFPPIGSVRIERSNIDRIEISRYDSVTIAAETKEIHLYEIRQAHINTQGDLRLFTRGSVIRNLYASGRICLLPGSDRPAADNSFFPVGSENYPDCQ